MTVSGATGHGAMHSMTAEQGRKVLGPSTELCGSHALGIIRGIVEDAEDSVSEDLRDRLGHACEAVHEEVDRIPAKEIERRAGTLGSVSPRIVMVQHVNEHDAQ